MARNGYGMVSRVTKCGRNHGLVWYNGMVQYSRSMNTTNVLCGDKKLFVAQFTCPDGK